MIGIVVPPAALNHQMRRFDNEDSILNQYKPLAAKYKVDVCLFSLSQIRLNVNRVKALVFSPVKGKVTPKVIPIPRVNLVRNTGYAKNKGLIRRFDRLRRQDIHLINFPLYRQGNKLHNYRYLGLHSQFKDHIPHTRRLSYAQLEWFLEQYGKVIIKPIYGSKGRRMTIIEKEPDQYRIYQTSSKKYDWHSSPRFNVHLKMITVPCSHLEQFYNEKFGKPASFLIQQWITFKTCHGLPFDIRAVVQKNGRNRWQVTSRIARVAHRKGQITNLSQGGEAVSLPKLNLGILQRDIRQFCLEVAGAFEKLYPWAAEMGIDLAIDNQGRLWYIETNFCPEKVRWATTFKIPFEYAHYLYTRKRANKMVLTGSGTPGPDYGLGFTEPGPEPGHILPGRA